MTNKKIIFNLLAFLLSALFLYLAFRNINFKEIFIIFSRVNFILLSSAIIFNFFTIYIKSIKFKLLLADSKNVSLKNVFKALTIGFAMNNILPGRLGEFARIYSLCKMEKLSKASVLATLISDRLFDAFGLIVVFFYMSLFFKGPVWVEKTIIVIASFAFVIYIALILLSIKKINIDINEKKSVLRFHVKHFFARIQEGASVLKKSKNTLIVSVLSISIWLMSVLLLFITQKSLNCNASFIASSFAVILINIAIALPSAPSGFGPFEYACILSYSYFGVDQNMALAIGLMLHIVVNVIPVTLLGIIFMIETNLKFKTITQEQN